MKKWKSEAPFKIKIRRGKRKEKEEGKVKKWSTFWNKDKKNKKKKEKWKSEAPFKIKIRRGKRKGKEEEKWKKWSAF